MKEQGNLRDELLIAYETDEPVENVLFQKERLVRVNAARTAFRGVVFESCAFEDCDFSSCDMRKTVFRKCLLAGCDFSGGYWNGCTLDSCNASGCTIDAIVISDSKRELVGAQVNLG